jgi:hypothetical protein
MHVLWIGCRKANSHFGKLTAVISNNWSKSTAVFCISEAVRNLSIRRHTTGNCHILSKKCDFFEAFVPNPEFPS